MANYSYVTIQARHDSGESGSVSPFVVRGSVSLTRVEPKVTGVTVFCNTVTHKIENGVLVGDKIRVETGTYYVQLRVDTKTVAGSVTLTTQHNESNPYNLGSMLIQAVGVSGSNDSVTIEQVRAIVADTVVDTADFVTKEQLKNLKVGSQPVFEVGKKYYSPVTYYWPDFYRGDQSQWSKVLRFGADLGIVILNRNSGDWADFDQDFKTQAQLAKNAGAKRTIFYVKTQYGAAGNPTDWGQNVPNADKFTKDYILSQLAHCKKHYGDLFEGVFLDEFINGWSNHEVRIPWYKDLVDTIRSTYGSDFLIVGNCGTTCSSGILELDVDVLVTYESTAAQYTASTSIDSIHNSDMARYPGSRFWHMIHDVTQENYMDVINKAEKIGVSHLYVTDGRLVIGEGGQWDPAVNPYAVAPSKWIEDTIHPWIKGTLGVVNATNELATKVANVERNYVKKSELPPPPTVPVSVVSVSVVNNRLKLTFSDNSIQYVNLPVVDGSGQDSGPSQSSKIVPLSLTVGQQDTIATGKYLTGRSLMIPMNWGAEVTRFKIHMRNINPRTGTMGTTIPVNITKVGVQSNGVFSESIDVGFSGNVSGDTDTVTDWIDYPLSPGTEYGIQFDYTGQTTDKILLNAGGSWVLGGTPWVGISTPFHFWIEAETPNETKVYTFNGDSLTAGIGSAVSGTTHMPVHMSWPYILCRLQSTLPIMYAASGDTMASWISDPSAYKVTLWDSGFAKGDVLFANMGSNDIFMDSSLNAVKTRSGQLIDILKQRINSGAPVVTTAILPRTGTPGDNQREINRREYNAWLAQSPSPVAAMKHINFIDAVSSDDDNIPADVAPDGTHPLTPGYQAIAENVNRQFSRSETVTPTFSG